MPVDFSNVLNTLKQGIVNIAGNELRDYVAQATQDGQGILNALNTQLQGWVTAAASGTISASDLEYLILAQKDQLEMVALKQAGIAAIAVDQFKADVFDLITTTLSALIP
jgi:hypothetical protein